MPTLLCPPLTAGHAAFRVALRADHGDDTVRLAYADYLDEQGNSQSATRMCWHVGVRVMLRAGVRWDQPCEWSQVRAAIGGIGAEWVRRLYSVEIARMIRDRYPLDLEWSKVNAVADDTLALAELYALGLATGGELSAAESAARSAARSITESAARSAAWGAAWNATRSDAENAAWSAAESAAQIYAAQTPPE
jgi:uncharacterized protein (TIGR02996 family)